MLINFTFENYRSFRDGKSLRMDTGSANGQDESALDMADERPSQIALIYGANASGKSNVLSALVAMRDIVLNSVKLNHNDKLEYNPFVLDVDSTSLPTSFEIQFIIGDLKYRYGFDYNLAEIKREWLYETRPKENESNLFLRVDKEYEISNGRFKEGIGLERITNGNRLFISLVAQLNGEISKNILYWFKKCLSLSDKNVDCTNRTLQMLFNKETGHEQIRDFLRQTQLGFYDITVDAYQVGGRTVMKAKTMHTIRGVNRNVVKEEAFPLDEMESEGAKKTIGFAGPIIDALQKGKLIVIDDLDAKLHPLLTQKIIQLFMSRDTNPYGAQLVCTVHDTHLLSIPNICRDQIWFVEKDETESSDLYSLLEFCEEDNSLGNGRYIQEEYINGRYGAIPLFV